MDLRYTLWIMLWLLGFYQDFSAAYNYGPADVHLKPSERYYTVWEGESQQIDCYVTDKDRTIDLRWEKRHSPPGNYSIEKTIEDNNDGTFTMHSIMKFKSVTPSDAGIYTCSFSPQPGYGSENSIKLEFQQRCEAGKYGIGCSSNCSEFCQKINTPWKESPCSYKDGHCLHGCLPGYRGATCSSVCGAGTYGKGCSSNCSEFCKVISTTEEESPCNYNDGHCRHGCLPGYWGSTCSSSCDLWMYGPDCSIACSPFCKEYGSLDKRWCEPKTGDCLDGSQDGAVGKDRRTADNEDNPLAVVTFVVIQLSLVLILIVLYTINSKLKRISTKWKMATTPTWT